MNTKVNFAPSTQLPQNLQNYLDNSYNDIHGFLWNEATLGTILLNQFQNELAITGNVAEIGLWFGKYFFLLSLFCKENETATGVDSFVHAENPTEHEQKFRDFLSKSVPNNNHVSILKKDSQTLSPKDLNNEIRLFSVDGDHTCPGALHDLKLAADCLTQGGVIIFDDFYNPTCPGVSEAYFKFDAQFNKHKLKPFAYIANKLFLTHQPFAQKYYDMFFEELRNNPNIPFRNPTLEFHQNHTNLKIPTQISETEILVVLPNSWQQ